jgi:hypothetical protein
MTDYQILQDEPHRRVIRIGDTVRRPVHPWSAAIHELLLYLESAGFPYSPRFLGIDDEGREVLSYLPGESGADAWSKVVADEGLVAMARDFGPWNLVWQGTRPVGVLDWDYAWPARPIHDVAYAVEYTAPFRDDQVCVECLRYPVPPDRRRRLERFAEAYGLSTTEGLVDEVITEQTQVLERARRLATEGRQPQAGWQAAGALDEVGERINWSVSHRHLFE